MTWDWMSLAMVMGAALWLVFALIQLERHRGNPRRFAQALALLDLAADVLPMFGIMGTVWGIGQTFVLFRGHERVPLGEIFQAFGPALTTTLVGLGGAAIMLITRAVARAVVQGGADADATAVQAPPPAEED